MSVKRKNTTRKLANKGNSDADWRTKSATSLDDYERQ